MAKKYLYLGKGKWCYTENCKAHSNNQTLKKTYIQHRQDGELEKAKIIAEQLAQTDEGKAVLAKTIVELITTKLGRKPMIGLDLDGTTGGLSEALRNHLFEEHNSSSSIKVTEEEWLKKYPAPDNYAFHAASTPWFKSLEDFKAQFTKAERAGMYLKVPVYENAKETLDELKNIGFNINAVTARSAEFNEDTVSWVASAKIPATKIKHVGEEKEKVENVDVYIEDSPSVISRLTNHNKLVLIREQLYNIKVPRIEGQSVSIKDWNDNVISKLLTLLDTRVHN